MIPINENFEKAYKDSMAKGFTVKELFAVFSAAASLAVVCVVCFFCPALEPVSLLLFGAASGGSDDPDRFLEIGKRPNGQGSL